ncbi:hypothetical protein GCM10027035_23260 [Emticicia sediminis]
MTIKILLIDTNQSNLNLVQNFIRNLGISECHFSDDYSNSVKMIDEINPDLVICNPFIFRKETTQFLSERVRKLSIPLLWLTTQESNPQPAIVLKYFLN